MKEAAFGREGADLGDEMVVGSEIVQDGTYFIPRSGSWISICSSRINIRTNLPYSDRAMNMLTDEAVLRKF